MIDGAGSTLALAPAAATRVAAVVPGLYAWVVLVLIAIIVALYWRGEVVRDRMAAQRERLKAELLAITAGLAAVPLDLGPDELAGHILRELTTHLGVAAASLYVPAEGAQAGLRRIGHSGLPRALPPELPRAYLDPTVGLVGRSLTQRAAFSSGDDGGAGYLVPGIRRGGVGLFPVLHRDDTVGLLVLEGETAGWFARDRDLVEVVVQEMAMVIVNARLERDAQERARYREMARVRSEILANVSHELRTPLGVLRGYLETLQASGARMPEAQRGEFLEVALSEERELEDMVDNLLAMSRIETAGVRVDGTWFRGADLRRAGLRALTPAAAGRVAWTEGKKGDDALLYGDLPQLAGVVHNLVQNAIKYSPGAVRVEMAPADGTGARVCVVDEGTGVREDELTRIFERFYRSPGNALSEIRGFGLGLSIARRVVEAHGGRIWAHNREGGGLAVCFEWPQPPRATGRPAAGKGGTSHG